MTFAEVHDTGLVSALGFHSKRESRRVKRGGGTERQGVSREGRSGVKRK